MLVNFKAALAARKMLQVDLALALGITPTLLSEVVNDRRQASPELRSKIAAALRVDERWLFERVTHIPGPASSAVAAPAVEAERVKAPA